MCLHHRSRFPPPLFSRPPFSYVPLELIRSDQILFCLKPLFYFGSNLLFSLMPLSFFSSSTWGLKTLTSAPNCHASPARRCPPSLSPAVSTALPTTPASKGGRRTPQMPPSFPPSPGRPHPLYTSLQSSNLPGAHAVLGDCPTPNGRCLQVGVEERRGCCSSSAGGFHCLSFPNSAPMGTEAPPPPPSHPLGRHLAPNPWPPPL